MKQGETFWVQLSATERTVGVWDPYIARSFGSAKPKLRDHVTAYRPRREEAAKLYRFDPIEYRHVSQASHDVCSFVLASREPHDQAWAAVGEATLLFGTMRAYLGNVIVTPEADWIGVMPDSHFAVKSEFLVVKPHDRLVYYWLHLLRSAEFRQSLPPGGGGTRPRLDCDTFLEIPVQIHSEGERRRIHDETKEIARSEWANRRRLALAWHGASHRGI